MKTATKFFDFIFLFNLLCLLLICNSIGAQQVQGLIVEHGTSAAQEGYINVGSQTGEHLALDQQNLQSKSAPGANYSSLFLNEFGGDTYIGARGSVNLGDLNAAGTNNFNAFNSLYIEGAGGGVGVGTSAPAGRLDVQGNATLNETVINARVNFIGATNIPAVEGYSVPDAGVWGTGGKFTGGWYGVHGIIPSTTTGTVSSYAVYGSNQATGTGTKYGVFGSASGTGNFAVYGNGDMKTSGRLFIGTNSTQEADAAAYELVVDGQAIMEEAFVKNSANWPDYVFEAEYELMPLDELAMLIKEKGHLPNILNEEEVKDGYALGEMQKSLLRKIEELTLYTIQANEKNNELQEQIIDLQNQMNKRRIFKRNKK